MPNFILFITMFIMIHLIYELKMFSYRNVVALSLYNLIGTFLHELSHFIVGLIFGARPAGIALFPKRVGDRLVLGSVVCENVTWFNALPVALAPISLFYVALEVYYSDMVVFGSGVLTFVVKVFLVVVLLSNSVPSKEDIKVAFSSMTGVLFYVGLAVAWYIWKIKGL